MQDTPTLSYQPLAVVLSPLARGVSNDDEDGLVRGWVRGWVRVGYYCHFIIPTPGSSVVASARGVINDKEGLGGLVRGWVSSAVRINLNPK